MARPANTYRGARRAASRKMARAVIRQAKRERAAKK